MMKRIVPLLVFCFMSLSIFCSEPVDPKKELLGNHIVDALLSKDGSIDSLKSFIENNGDLVTPANLEKFTIRTGKRALYILGDAFSHINHNAGSNPPQLKDICSVSALLNALDEQLYPNKQEIMDLLGLHIVQDVTRRPKSKDRAVADVVAKYLDVSGLNYELLVHAYTQCPIDLRLYYYERTGKSNDVTLAQRLDSLITYCDTYRDQWRPDSLVNCDPSWVYTLQNLTFKAMQGVPKGPIEFNEAYFGHLVLNAVLVPESASVDTLINGVMLPKRAFTELQKYLKSYDKVVHPPIDLLVIGRDIIVEDRFKKYIDPSLTYTGMVLGAFLDTLDPNIYKRRNSVLELIAPDRKLPANAAENEEAARATVIAALKDVLADRELLYDILRAEDPKAVYALSLLKHHPLSFDTTTYDGVRSFARVIDHKGVRYPLSESFKVYRDDSARLFEEDSLMDLIACCLMHDNNEMHEDLDSFRFMHANTFPKPKKRTFSSSLPWNNDYVCVKLGEFFDQMNPLVFPRKARLEKALFLGVNKTVHTAETDKKFLENLLRASLEKPFMGELFTYGCQRYKVVYGVEAGVDENTPYRQEAVADRIAQCRDPKLMERYKGFLNEPFFKRVKIAEKTESSHSQDKMSKNRTLTLDKGGVEWGKLAIASLVVGIAGYIWYRNLQKNSGPLASKIGSVGRPTAYRR